MPDRERDREPGPIQGGTSPQYGQTMTACAYEVIVWVDATNVATWLDADELNEWAKDGGWICQNVGWVSYEDDDCVVLSARRSNSGHWGLSERIPKQAIRDRRPQKAQ